MRTGSGMWPIGLLINGAEYSDFASTVSVTYRLQCDY
jgi:hypothetical protein